MRLFGTMLLVATLLSLACGDEDPPGTEADHYGVGAQCVNSDDCMQPVNDTDPQQECLTRFKGGYCGIEDCQGNEDCPDGSACVSYDGGTYCFRICFDKSECNLNRDPDNESNCSANIDFLEDTPGKPCVPPSG